MADKFQKKALTDANTNTLGNRVATGGLEDFGSSKVLPLTQTKRGLVTKMVANREEPEPAVPVQWDTHHASSPGDIEGIQMVPRATITRAPFLDKPAVVAEANGEIELRVVKNDGTRESTIILTGLINLFQKQLPKMPKEKITRLVYDRNHHSLAIVRMPLEVIAGITYREFPTRKFAEIVFCAVSSDHQVKGYGAHLMNHLKDYVKASTPIMHILTYADNFATSYFQKQGFTKDISLPKSVWMGYIKDYEGGTLMQCDLLPRIRYLESRRMLRKQSETVVAKMRGLSIIHQPPQQWASANGALTPIDPLSIPGIRETGWSPAMDDESTLAPRGGPHFNQS